MINAGADFPAMVVSPQLSAGNWTTQTAEVDVPAELNALVDRIVQQHNVDESRIYVTGLSLGGGGAWNYARIYNHRVAAVVPVCGVGINRTNMASLQSMGVWAFHSLGDTVVNANASKQSMNAVAGTPNDQATGVMHDYPDDGNENVVSREANEWVWRRGRFNATGSLRYTVFPDSSHNAWSRAYNDNGAPTSALWQWLFSQRRRPEP
jgi:predicted peptidase